MCAGDLDALAFGTALFCKESICQEITFGAPQPGAARAREKKRRDDQRRWRASGACQREEAHAASGKRPAEGCGGRSSRFPQRQSCVSPKSALADLRLDTQLALESAPSPAVRGRSPGTARIRSRVGLAGRGAPPWFASRVRTARSRVVKDRARTSASEPPAKHGAPDSRQEDQDSLPRSQTYTEGMHTDAHSDIRLIVKNTFISFEDVAPSQRSRSRSCPAPIFPARPQRQRSAAAAADTREAEDWNPRDQQRPARERSSEANRQPSAAAQCQQPPADAALVTEVSSFFGFEDGPGCNIVDAVVVMVVPAPVPEASSRAGTPPRLSAAAAAPPPPPGAARAGEARSRACTPPRPSAAAAGWRPPPCLHFARGNCKFGDRCDYRAGHLLPDTTFEISLTRESGAELGLEADHLGTVLRITAVMEEGLVSEWSANWPSMSVKVGDYITAVNGTPSGRACRPSNGKADAPTSILNKIRKEGPSAKELRLTIMRMAAQDHEKEEGQGQASTRQPPEPRLPPVEELQNGAGRAVLVRWPGAFSCSSCKPMSRAGKGRLQPSDWRGLRSQQCSDCAVLQSSGSGKGLGKGIGRAKAGGNCRRCGRPGHWGNECKATEEERQRHSDAWQQEEAARALGALCSRLLER